VKTVLKSVDFDEVAEKNKLMFRVIYAYASTAFVLHKWTVFRILDHWLQKIQNVPPRFEQEWVKDTVYVYQYGE